MPKNLKLYRSVVQLMKYVAGSSENFTLEHRIFNLCSFVITLFCIQGGILNYLLGLHWMTYALSFLGLIVSFVIFIISRVKGRFSDQLIVRYSIATVVILGPMHFYNGGVNGTIIYLIIMLLNIFLLVSKRVFFPIYLLLTLTIISIILIEFVVPTTVVDYNTFSDKMVDHLTVLIYSTFFTMISIYIFKTNYQHDRNVLIEQKKLLEESEIEIKIKNERIENLLKEMHHRVKNNMQVSSSILEMQAFQSTDEMVKKAIQESSMRLNAMTLIHQKLNLSDDNSSIRLKEYIDELLENLKISLSDNQTEITWNLNLPSDLTSEHPLSIGLIINELVTNANKHSTNSINRTTIHVDISNITDNSFKISVSDNGQVELKLNEVLLNKSVGITLIQKLVAQLNGNIQLQYHQGNTFIVLIPLKK